MVFGPRFFDALPLHIRRDVLASVLERGNVIDDVAGAGARDSEFHHDLYGQRLYEQRPNRLPGWAYTYRS